MLEARGVSYAAGDSWLVRDADLDVRAGEVLSVVGPNGAGKSTLLRLLAGELQPSTGEVRLAGRPLSALRPRELALVRAVLPQQTVLQFAFSSRDVVLLGRNPHLNGDWPAREDVAIAERALASTEMTPYALRSYPSLSGGEQSRVTLARVLAQEAPLLMLDEPTSSLDVKHQEMVMRVAERLALEGAAVVMIVHDLNLAAAYSNRIALMQAGRIVACGSRGEVLREDLLSEVFDCELRILRDGGCRALIVPRRP